MFTSIRIIAPIYDICIKRLYLTHKTKPMKKILFSALIAAGLFACISETKPTFDLTNAKKEIAAANLEITEFLAKGDSVGVASVYSSDGAIMVSNVPSIKGRENLTAFWGGFIRSGAGAVSLTTSEIWGDENYITEEGVFEIKAKDNSSTQKGKYLVLWKKEDGKWKLHRDMSSSDSPAVSK